MTDLPTDAEIKQGEWRQPLHTDHSVDHKDYLLVPFYCT
jgi:hypothetical protein